MVFRYNEAAGISSLDPAYSRNLENIWACHQLFNGLVRMDPELHVQPDIAKNWDIDSTGTRYTFHLRDDVRFHDSKVFENGEGRRVTAQDVVYSFKRVADPDLAAPGLWVFSNVDDPLGDGIRAPDDSTVVIELKRSFPPFLGLLSMKYCSVIPKEAIEEYGEEFRKQPVGTGPFKFHFWIEGERLVMLRNEHFYHTDSAGNSLPYLDAVSVSFLSDKSAAYLELLKGKFDFMSGLHASYIDEILTPNGELNPAFEEDYYMQKQPYLKTDYLGFQCDSASPGGEDSPLTDPLVRKAINYGIDRVSMVRYLRNNVFRPAHGGMVPAGMPSFSEDIGYSYNPDSARALLQRAGYPDGKGFPEITLSTTSDYVDLCEFAQHQLEELGIPVNVEVLPAATHREQAAQAQLQFFRKSWIADYPDGENFLSLFYSPNYTPRGPNYTRYSNPQYDTLYQKALRISDEQARQRIYHQMDSLAMSDAPVVPLYYDVVVRFVSKDVKGLTSNPLNLLDLRKVKVEPNE